MGTDIHWCMERRDEDGRWHLAAYDMRAWDIAGAKGRRYDWNAPENQSREHLGSRNYALFNALSGLRGSRGDNAPPLLPERIPDDASDAAGLLSESCDYHTHGHADGVLLSEFRLDEDAKAALEGLDDDEYMRKGPLYASWWAEAALQTMEEGSCDEILPALSDSDEGWSWADLNGSESQHEKLERLARSKKLVDWREDPTSWRILVWYDN